MADVYDHWHKTYPKKDDTECPEHKGKVPTSAHGKGKRWQVRYRDSSGEQRALNFDRKVDAEAAADSVGNDLRQGTYIDPGAGKITLQRYAQRWLAAATAGMGTVDAYEGVVRNHIEPHLGRYELRSLSQPSLIQGWVKKLQQAGLEASTIAWAASILTAVLDAAVDDGLIVKNPCKANSVKLPRKPRKKVVPWTIERVHAVIDQLPERFQAGGKLTFGCGLRQGEAFGMAVEDIDFARKLVRVNRQIKLVRSTMVFALPKGDRVREVPLPEELARVLEQHIKRFSPKRVALPWRTPDGEVRTFRLLFTTDEGKGYHRSVFNQYDWKAALAAAGVIPPREKGSPRYAAAPDDGMHALRHAYASVLLDAGESIKALSEYLGHSDPGFTLRTYTHLMPQSEARTRQAIDAAFAPPPGGGTAKQDHAHLCPQCALAA
ncbi:site-specific integrase [Streptomyces sp. NBC_01808]|uniref:tyrosine-type recombinase/integrase n=1 Tax=Streptomyces sp. NBC_01808 TaxID=2975947 RepID=UPI002DD9C2EB|nr:tyrosine-type recombinase/integrase [Streptomyces sp. NBC_01808]WSA38957.1 site-specific integrase [Streptomyces sp. NBC_01808]